MNKLKKCKICGADIAVNAMACPACGAKNKKPIYQRPWLWILIIVVVLAIIGGALGSGGTKSNKKGEEESSQSSSQQSSVNSVSAPASKFDGDCGISATAEMGTTIINYPELTISISNTSDKEISAIQFYFVPYDVYDEEITGWTSQNKLYTDTAIPAGESTSISYQFIEKSVKKGKLYLYSVYFSDGTEWGDKDARKSTILEDGLSIEVN